MLPDQAASAPRRQARRYLPRLSEDPDRRSVQIGIGATVLIHLLLFAVLPDKMDNDLVGSFVPEHRATGGSSFNIEITPEEFLDIKAPEKPSAPTKFVETNPDVPDNEPDRTDNFGAQNQQAAQEQKAKETGGDRPEMEGRTDIESTQVVTGNLTEQQPVPPLPPVPVTPEAQTAEKESQMMQREQNPLPGFEKYVGESKDAYGSNIAKIAPHPEDVKEKVEGDPNAPANAQGTGQQAASINRLQPRPRPILERRVRPALFAENRIGTSNIGPAAVDARWSNYGTYLQKMIEAVQMAWDKINLQSKTFPAPGSIVTVKFVLNSEGSIARILSVSGGMSGAQAEGGCVAAITSPSPYGAWSDDMVAVLGQEQEMTFAFYYL